MNISPNFIAKIEGHGELIIDWSKDDVKLKIYEGERLFEGILVGRSAEEMHWITPRICGVCPIAHNLASLMALENALGIKVNETTKMLREMMVSAQIMQSHVLHLYFLALPDYLGIDRATELETKNHRAFEAALNLKEASDDLAQTVAGRNVHPTTTAIGGFHQIPTKQELKRLIIKLENAKKDALFTSELCLKLDYPKIKADLEFISQKDEKIISSKKDSSLIDDYKKDMEEEIKDYSTAKFGKYRSRTIMVGALARLATQSESLMPLAAKILKKSEIDFKNPYHNNLAQGIEIVHFLEKAIILIDKLIESDMDDRIQKPDPSAKLKGIGAVEAPRGGLYHEVKLNKENIIVEANIITPTVQNLTSIEQSAQTVIKQTKNLPKETREKLLNMLVRAYDPCITCATH